MHQHFSKPKIFQQNNEFLVSAKKVLDDRNADFFKFVWLKYRDEACCQRTLL